MSMWRTEEWKRFKEQFKMEEYHMKPTTIIASALKMLRELDGWRGLCVNVVMCRRRVLHGLMV